MPKGYTTSGKKRGRKKGQAYKPVNNNQSPRAMWWCPKCRNHVELSDLQIVYEASMIPLRTCPKCKAFVEPVTDKPLWDVSKDLETAIHRDTPSGICYVIKFCVPKIHKELGLKVDLHNRFEP